MIRAMEQNDIQECVALIRCSFNTVAEEFHITPENAPRFTAFAMNEERLLWHYHTEHRPMFVYCDGETIVGYYSLAIKEHGECELNNLCVLPSYRHKGIGGQLLTHSFLQAKALGCTVMNLGIVEENQVLRRWYELADFTHVGTEKFDFFPFTCGYMKKQLV